jgi:hypothetical protein
MADMTHMIQGHTTIETLMRINLPVPYPMWAVSKQRARVIRCERCLRPVNPCCYMYRWDKHSGDTPALMCWQCKDLYECWLEHEYRKVSP